MRPCMAVRRNLELGHGPRARFGAWAGIVMQSNGDSRTRSTLLLRLRDLSDRAAWEEFLDSYAPKIYGWCRRFHLQEADAADVTQEVLGKLVSALRRFDYDPARGSFRG